MADRKSRIMEDFRKILMDYLPTLLRELEGNENIAEIEQEVIASMLSSNLVEAMDEYWMGRFEAFLRGDSNMLEKVENTFRSHRQGIIRDARKTAGLKVKDNYPEWRPDVQWLRQFMEAPVKADFAEMGEFSSLTEYIASTLPKLEEPRIEKLADMCQTMVEWVPKEVKPQFVKAFVSAVSSEDFVSFMENIEDELELDRALDVLAEMYRMLMEWSPGEALEPEFFTKLFKSFSSGDLMELIHSMREEAMGLLGDEGIDGYSTVHDNLKTLANISYELKAILNGVDWNNEGLEGAKELQEGLADYLTQKWYDEFRQGGVAAGTSVGAESARAFNEAFAKEASPTAFAAEAIMTDAGPMRAGSGLDPSRSFTPLAEDLSNIDDVAGEVSLKLLELAQQVETMGHLEGFKEMQANALGAAQALLAMPDALSPMHRGLLETTVAFGQQDAQMRKFAQNAPMFGEFKKGVEGLANAGKQKLTPELEKMGKELGFTNTTVKGAQVSMQAYEKEMLATADNADALGVQLLLLSSQAYIDGQITLDEQQAIEAAVAAGMSVDEFAAKCAEYGIDLKDSGAKRGGGGKSRKDRAAEEARKAAEEARRAQEAAWQKALDDQLKFLDRKKRLGEIDTQEEIRRLELIAAKYAKTTQQKIAMEDKLFEARARLRDEEIGQIDKLNQGIITAIRSRYEEQRKIEENRLQESSDSWRKWADESVKAIQAQIDALDDLAKFEDREEQERKKLHKIEATKQMIEFTHDEANKEQLERELKRLEEDFAKWQRNNAIADAKEQLRAEQDAIRERASQEQEGIAKQREELHELYDERLKEMSLRAEAERMLVKGNQEEILDLITSYAPEYDAAGKTLGQKLFEGLTGEFGSLTEWFDSLNADIGNIFDHMRERALSAADIHLVGTAQRESQQSNMAPPINVEQHNHFHVPVESPSDTARRIQQVNEELGRQILSRSF